MDCITDAVFKKNVKFLCQEFFQMDITPTQEVIIRNIAYSESKRLVISAHTRYGKSLSVAMGVLLYILFNRNKKIKLIAPIQEQSNILRNYIADFCMRSNVMLNMLDINVTGDERFKKEVSRRRITFKNNCELHVLSAEGEAKRLMGHGGDLVILDESALIDYEVFRAKISRMLGDSPDSVLIELGNPWHKNNQMWLHWKDLTFTKIHVPWQVGLAEGRITENYINEQRTLLSPLEFKVLYDAEFPEDTKDVLIRYEWVQKALANTVVMPATKVVVGLDVAEAGKDLTVMTLAYSYKNTFNVFHIKSWHQADTMITANYVEDELNKLGIRKAIINVDATGVGKGVGDRLIQLGHTVNLVKCGESPSTEKYRFVNKKAEYCWRLRGLFEEGSIHIPKHNNLITELSQVKWEINSRRKIMILDAKNSPKLVKSTKSPDYFDSLYLCCCSISTPIQMVRR